MSHVEKTVEAGRLNVAYREYGAPDGWPVILCHGFPYDIEAYAEAAPLLAAAGARVLVPSLRGYGTTHFLSEDTPRSGEQAVLGDDLRAFMDALKIERAVLGGYDWGGRACCVVSLMWPERVQALVTGNGYNIHDVARSMEPAPPEAEMQLWYQFYFNMERGRLGLEHNRAGIIDKIWRDWSPTWGFDLDCFNRSLPSFYHPDFVEIVIHSYRVRYGLAKNDPAVAHIEDFLAKQPAITVPAISIDGDSSGLPINSQNHTKKFTGPYEFRVFEGAGHNLPQERPRDWAQAILDARGMAEN